MGAYDITAEDRSNEDERISPDHAPFRWLDGLPVGNGRLAAMVCGGPGCSRLALNHE